MLVQCWSTVYDAGPTLNQHWHFISNNNSKGGVFAGMSAIKVGQVMDAWVDP